MFCVRTFVVVGSIMLLAGCNGATTGGLSAGSTTPSGASATGVTVGEGDGTVRVVAQLPAPEGNGQGNSRIAAQDVVEVDIFQVDELDRTVQVGNNGAIQLPLIGSVQAAGRTVPELERAISAAYSRNYLQNPQVSVFLKSSTSQQVTLDGEVRKPGVYDATVRSSLSSLIAGAGGFNDIADPSKIVIFRNVGNQRLAAQYSLTKVRAGEAVDPRIYGSDVIVVFGSSSKLALRNLKEALGVATGVGRVVPLL